MHNYIVLKEQFEKLFPNCKTLPDGGAQAFSIFLLALAIEEVGECISDGFQVLSGTIEEQLSPINETLKRK